IRLSIDKPGGVGADDCALVSIRLSPVLDEADPIPGAYDLAVSSPGIERPVQRLADFQRVTGYRVRIRMEEGLPRRRYTGRLVRAGGDEVVVHVDGEDHVLPFDAIVAAHLVLDLDEYQALADGLPPIPGTDDVPDADADSTRSRADGAHDAAPQGDRDDQEVP
ncbi:MAG: ribosome maturation factor RimP, partial [Phycisphaerales bacterium]|nr:ribosome maturation factor RimP [Phycisphaerales bacterium]